jgi:hypothetical protein
LDLREPLARGTEAVLGASILRKYVRPVAESLNILKRIGWHTFRHTYSTLLRSAGAEFKVIQQLIRHLQIVHPAAGGHDLINDDVLPTFAGSCEPDLG